MKKKKDGGGDEKQNLLNSFSFFPLQKKTHNEQRSHETHWSQHFVVLFLVSGRMCGEELDGDLDNCPSVLNLKPPPPPPPVSRPRVQKNKRENIEKIERVLRRKNTSICPRLTSL